jgi:predicted metallo-beta-lactamase superfamily hydrolase
MDTAIEIIGTQSPGVRGLCCLIKTVERRIVIDSGVALEYLRNRLHPHRLQVAEGEQVRQRMLCSAVFMVNISPSGGNACAGKLA